MYYSLPSLDDYSLEHISIEQFSYDKDVTIAHPTKYDIRLNYLINGWKTKVFRLRFEVTTIPGFLANDIELVDLGGLPFSLSRMDYRKIRKIINNHINSHFN